MVDRRTKIIADLEKGLDASMAFFKSFKPAELNVQVYAEAPAWTVKQVLAHFITIEKSMQWLFKDMLAGGPGSPEDFDLERYNRTQPPKYDGFAVDALLLKYGTVRRKTISLVRGMAESDLDREGRHPTGRPGVCAGPTWKEPCMCRWRCGRGSYGANWKRIPGRNCSSRPAT